MLESSFGVEQFNGYWGTNGCILSRNKLDSYLHCNLSHHASIGIPIRGGILTPFFIKPKPCLGWHKEIFGVTSPEVVSSTTQVAPHYLFDACALYFDVHNKALLGHGSNPKMDIILDRVDYPLFPVSSRHVRSWGSTNTLEPDSTYHQGIYLSRRIQPIVTNKLSAKEKLNYLAFRTTENNEHVRIDTEGLYLKKIGENIDFILSFEVESEGGRKVMISQQYRVRFTAWDNPTVETINDSS